MNRNEQDESYSTGGLRRKAPEIGTLWADRHGGSRFIGSAFGVFFLRTVQNTFSNAASRLRKADHTDANVANNPSQAQLSPEYFFGNEEGATSRLTDNGALADQQHQNQQQCPSQDSWTFLSPPPKMPSYEIVKQLTKIYFQQWHPLVPFLHGPTFLRETEERLASGDAARNQFKLSQSVMIHCICNIALLDAPGLTPLPELNPCSPEKLLPALSVLAINDTLASVQALLSAQLYFLATLSFRSASVTGGLMIRAIMKAGLHRCPFRYPELSPLDREMRKRVFWSAYALDRFLSQALGQPLGIQDADIDVCLPGPSDLHAPVSSTSQVSPESLAELAVHLPRGHPDHLTFNVGHRKSTHTHQSADPVGESLVSTTQNSPPPGSVSTIKSSAQHQGKSIFPEFVAASRLVGHALETFHVSIHVRSASPQDVLALKADIEAWGNNSAPQWAHQASGNAADESHNAHKSPSIDATHSIFLSISYYQLVLLVNRPYLALEQRSSEFKLALQTCVTAAKSILQTLESFVRRKSNIFWPGHLLAVWMSGLVIAFAGRLGAYDAQKAVIGLVQSIDLLTTMSVRWPRAKACIAVLEELLVDIRNDRHIASHPASLGGSQHLSKKRKHNDPKAADTQSSRRDERARDVRANRELGIRSFSLTNDAARRGSTASYNQFDQAWQQKNNASQTPARPLPVHSTSHGADYSRQDFSYHQPTPAQVPGVWFGLEHHAPPVTTNTLPDDSLDLPDFNGEELWSTNFEPDFMVWDSLQQLVTNNF